MTRSKNPADRVAGYSLLEILIVLAIIGMIVALVGPRLFAQLDKSKITAARVQMKSLKSAVMTMRLDIDRFPTGEEGLKLLEKAPTEVEGWGGPYLDGTLPKDPWGRDYLYAPPATSNDSPTLSTLGADGKPGGEGNNADIVV
jgi:general secretion pathway protein G